MTENTMTRERKDKKDKEEFILYAFNAKLLLFVMLINA
jgi:hypothetical protein